MGECSDFPPPTSIGGGQSLDLLGQLYLNNFKRFVKIAYLSFLFLKIKNQRILTFGFPPKPSISFWFE